MDEQMSLANHLLIATPSLDDPSFFHAVVYVCEHHVQGTVGLIINYPMKQKAKLVFDQLNLKAARPEQNRRPLLFGGPIQPERGFVLHRPQGNWSSSLVLIPNEVTITTSNDIIRALAEDRGPKDAMVILGYVAWSENQLIEEIQKNVWMVCPFKPELLYDVPFEDRWAEAGLSIGIKMNQLTFGAGHA